MAWMPWQNKAVAKTLRSHSVPNLQGLYNIPNNTGQSTGIHSLTHVKTWSYPQDLWFFLIAISKNNCLFSLQSIFLDCWFNLFSLLFKISNELNDYWLNRSGADRHHQRPVCLLCGVLPGLCLFFAIPAFSFQQVNLVWWDWDQVTDLATANYSGSLLSKASELLSKYACMTVHLNCEMPLNHFAAFEKINE